MNSIWTDTVTLQKRSPLKEDMDVKTAIIGAGLAGVLIGYMLKQKGIDAVILEADRIGRGTTGRTTAKITSQHGVIYQRLLKDYGREKAKHYAGFQEWAVGEYEKIAREKRISCDFVRCNANLYSCMAPEILKAEAEAAIALGIQTVYRKECELPFPVKGVLTYENQAAFHPLKFIEGIAGDLRIFEKTKVIRVEYEGQKESRLITDSGTVRAENVVFACHFPFVNVPGYYFARMSQSRSYVLALKKAQKLEGYYLGIDGDSYSFRSEGETMLFGGGGHRTGELKEGEMTKEACGYQPLRKKAEELWKGSKETACWSAQDCMTLDQIPYIGRFSKRRKNWYVATGFGKWGMTSAMVSGRIISCMLEGMDVPEADIFSPQRRLSQSGVKKLAENQKTAVKGLVSMEPARRCTHMGCRLSWNPEEGTWECPCHGSRFGREGKLLDGPAVKELKKI